MYNEYNMRYPNYNYMPKRGINWNNILNNTQRTLGIINQAIPIVYQVRPLFPSLTLYGQKSSQAYIKSRFFIF